MGPPKGGDGAERAIEFALPSIGVVIAVTLTKEFYGGTAAGFIYLFLLSALFLGFLASAKYWNVAYTTGFVLAGVVFWTMIPGVISEIVHPVFGAIGTILGLVFFVAMVILLAEKAGLDDLLEEL